MKRIWVANHLETPAPWTSGLFDTEKHHRCEQRVEELVLLIGNQIWGRVPGPGPPCLRALMDGDPRAALFLFIADLFSGTGSPVQGWNGNSYLFSLQVMKVFFPLAISHDKASDNGIL